MRVIIIAALLFLLTSESSAFINTPTPWNHLAIRPVAARTTRHTPPLQVVSNPRAVENHADAATKRRRPFQRLRNLCSHIVSRGKRRVTTIKKHQMLPLFTMALTSKENLVVSEQRGIFASRLRRFLLVVVLPLVTLATTGRPAWAGGGGFGRPADAPPLPPLTRRETLSLGSLWFCLFTVLALLHAAEIAVTTLYPWKGMLFGVVL